MTPESRLAARLCRFSVARMLRRKPVADGGLAIIIIIIGRGIPPAMGNGATELRRGAGITFPFSAILSVLVLILIYDIVCK